jgi:hypothetical protein
MPYAYWLRHTQVQYGKSSAELKRPATSTIADLKAGVPVALQAHRLLPFAGGANVNLLLWCNTCGWLLLYSSSQPGCLVPVLQAEVERRCCTLSLVFLVDKG